MATFAFICLHFLTFSFIFFMNLLTSLLNLLSFSSWICWHLYLICLHFSFNKVFFVIFGVFFFWLGLSILLGQYYNTRRGRFARFCAQRRRRTSWSYCHWHAAVLFGGHFHSYKHGPKITFFMDLFFGIIWWCLAVRLSYCFFSQYSSFFAFWWSISSKSGRERALAVDEESRLQRHLVAFFGV